MKNILEKHFLSVKKKRDAGLVLFDNAATAQLSDFVIQAMVDFYLNDNFPGNGASYEQVEKSVSSINLCKRKVLKFVGVEKDFGVAFCKNATEGLALILRNFVASNFKAGEKVLITNLEHNSVYKPIFKLTSNLGGQVDQLDLFSLKASLKAVENVGYKFVCLTMASNVLGQVWKDNFSDLAEVISVLKNNYSIVALDACQALSHNKVDLASLGADFLFFSGHKFGAPHGIGAIIGKNHLLKNMADFVGSNSMSKDVFKDSSANEFKELEPGSPSMAQIIGLSAAIDFYYKNIDLIETGKDVEKLADSIVEFLKRYKWVKILGQDYNFKISYIISFIPGQIPLHDFSWVLGQKGVLVRSGKMCADLACDNLSINGCIRISLFYYNNDQDCQKFFNAFEQTVEFFKERL